MAKNISFGFQSENLIEMLGNAEKASQVTLDALVSGGLKWPPDPWLVVIGPLGLALTSQFSGYLCLYFPITSL